MKPRWLPRMFIAIMLIVALCFVAGYAYMHTVTFGAFPQGTRLQRVEASPNYHNGEFQNLEPIPSMTSEKKNVAQGLLSFLLTKKERTRPEAVLPSVKTDLKALDKNEDVVIWLGHSSFYVQLAGQSLLIDPVFSNNAAPIPMVNRAFQGSNIYSAEDMPNVDILLITHDHWDHLDYPTVMALKNKVAKIVCPLGVGAHFDRWGFAESRIVELDWQDKMPIENNLVIHALPARHFSGRALIRNKTLWAAYALISPKFKMYFSGDSGYGQHFQKAGADFGGFDLVMLDSGQYNEDWRYVHMMPEDSAQAAADLQAKVLLPAHVGKFSISSHAWDDPFTRIEAASAKQTFSLNTPKIGEMLKLTTEPQHFSPWWKD